jgi:hypothetical protein
MLEWDYEDLGIRIAVRPKTVAKLIELEVNGTKYPVHSDDDTPLLFVLREEIGLTGTKYGCGEGQCGACTVLIGGSPRRSCQVPVGEATQPIRTIEDLGKKRPVASPAGISGPRGVSVRLLHIGNDHERSCAFGAELDSVGCGGFSIHAGEYLPLRNLSANRRRDSTANTVPEPERYKFRESPPARPIPFIVSVLPTRHLFGPC